MLTLRFRPGSILLLAAFIFSLQAAAQSRSSPEVLQDETIRIGTELVVLDVQVLNKKSGEIINGLRPQDFELYEDGTRQEITHFSQDKLPLSVILLVDLSSSVSPVLREIRDGALLALKRLKDKDEVAIMAFSSSTQLVQSFTTDRQLIVDRISQIEKTPVIGQGTSLYQALRDAALHMNSASNPTSRRVIIAITDNIAFEYHHFGLSEKEVSDQVIESGSMVCGLIVEGAMTKSTKIFDRKPDSQDIYRRRMSIDPFASETGGEVIKAEKNEINARLALLIDHLRTRYSLGFSPKRERHDGSYRQIRLNLTADARKRLGEVVVKAKQGYYARPRSQKAALPPGQ
ncbi:MAG TPA: VWA domain-containing protein [Blastocatellia bacterium]|nr:VWA domain-containing protein [Blastocatellia bacterium]